MVVLSGASGHTHLLSPSGTQILLALLEADKDLAVDDLATLLLGHAPDTDEVAALEAQLSEFRELGLVETASQ